MARVLLVDDDIEQIAAVRRALTQAGHQPVVATNASDARSAFDMAPPDAVLVSAACEGGEGLALAEALLAEAGPHRAAVVQLGGPEVPGRPTVGTPVDPAALEATLRSALAATSSRRATHPPSAVPLHGAAPASPAAPRAPAPSPAPAAAAPGARAAPDQGPVPVSFPTVARPPGSAPPRPTPQPRPRLAVPPRPEAPPTTPAAPPATAHGDASTPDAWFEADAASGEEGSRPLTGPDLDELAHLREAARQLPRIEAPPPAREARDAALADATEQLRLAGERARPAGPPRQPSVAAEAERLRRRLEEEALAAGEVARQRAAPRPAPAAAVELRAHDDGAARAGERRPDPSAAAAQAAQVAEDAARAAAAQAARQRVLAVARQRQVVQQAEPPPGAPLPPELAGGALAQTSMPRLLSLAAQGKVTGRLEVGQPPERLLWFEGGRIVGARSAVAGERADEIAVRLGLIGRDAQRQLAPALAELGSRRIGVVLLERGLLKPTELTLLARRAAEEVLFAAFAAEAPYRLHPEERVPPEERLALERGTLALAVDGVRRRWTGSRLDVVLGGPATLLAPLPGTPPAASLGLSPEEARVVALADGLRTLEEIIADAPLDPLSARQALAALVEVGALEVRFREPVGAAPAPTSTDLDLVRVKEKLQVARRADYFAILGLPRSCTPYEIREVAARLLAELSPERFGGAAPPGLDDELAEIRQVVEEAREVLSDDALRAEYVAALGG